MCTKRLAASSGDVRGAFAICSRATEIAERANAAQVSDDHVAEAVSELLSPVRMSLLKSLSYDSLPIPCDSTKVSTSPPSDYTSE